jgi:acyl-CoA dehydrogenase
MRRDLVAEDHEAFRELARDFVEKEVVPAYPEREKGGRMPHDVCDFLLETLLFG